MAAQTEDKKLDGAGLSVLWGLIKNIIPTVPTNVSSFTNDAAYVSQLETHNQNLVLASPNGASGLPSFRALAASDIPDLSGTYLTSHQTIYGLTLQGDGTTVSTFTPNTAALTFNIKAGSNISITRGTNELTIANTYSYSHPTGGANTTISAANGKVLSAITVDNLGHVTSVSSKTLTTSDIPDLSGTYLPLGGGTMTGGNISWTSDSHGIYFINNCGIEKWSGYAPALVAEGDNTNFLIRNGVNRAENYKILHEGNIQSYLSKRSVTEKSRVYVLELKNAWHGGDTAGKVGSGLKLALGGDNENGKYCGITSEAAANWENSVNMLFFIKNRGDSDEVEVMRILNNKNVGIGTINPQYKLHVDGAVGATAFTNTSDIRNKDFISDTSMSIEQIANAPSFLFKWKTGDDRNVHAGSSAQYWQTVLPEIITAAQDEQRTLSMQYDVIALLSSITIAREVVNDKEKIRQLEERVTELESQIAN